MRSRWLALLVGLAPTIADAGCKELAAAVESAQKEIAYLRNRVDNSTPPQPLLEQRLSLHMAGITANLTMMVAAKCPLPTMPVDANGSAYSKAAEACAMAPGETRTELCKQENWKRESGK